MTAALPPPPTPPLCPTDAPGRGLEATGRRPGPGPTAAPRPPHSPLGRWRGAGAGPGNRSRAPPLAGRAPARLPARRRIRVRRPAHRRPPAAVPPAAARRRPPRRLLVADGGGVVAAAVVVLREAGAGWREVNCKGEDGGGIRPSSWAVEVAGFYCFNLHARWQRAAIDERRPFRWSAPTQPARLAGFAQCEHGHIDPVRNSMRRRHCGTH